MTSHTTAMDIEELLYDLGDELALRKKCPLWITDLGNIRQSSASYPILNALFLLPRP
jgi:hypothetical protein